MSMFHAVLRSCWLALLLALASAPLRADEAALADAVGLTGAAVWLDKNDRAALGFRFDAGLALKLTTAAVAALTLASVAVYLREWVRHMGVNGIKR